jgi:cysteine synthase
VRLAQTLSAQNPDWVFLYQYANPANPEAHYRTTGPEILADVPEITHFVAGLGHLGHPDGRGALLERAPTGCTGLGGGASEWRDGRRPAQPRRRLHSPIFIDNHGEDLLDRKVVVRPRESIEWTRRFTEVGLFVGLSSGAIMAGAVKCANLIPDNETATIVTIVCDDGWKYLSTGAWSDDIDDVVERAKKIIYF